MNWKLSFEAAPFQRPRTPSSRAMVLYASRVLLYLLPPSDTRTWAWNRTLTTSVGCATATAMAPVVEPARRRVPIPAPVKHVHMKQDDEATRLKRRSLAHSRFPECRTASWSRRGRFGPRRSSSVSGAPPPGRCRGSGGPRCAPWWRWCQTHPGTLCHCLPPRFEILPGSVSVG